MGTMDYGPFRPLGALNHGEIVEMLNRVRSNILTITTHYSVSDDDDIIVADSPTTIYATLPDYRTRVGKTFTFKNVNVGALIIDSFGGSIIDGSDSSTLNQWGRVTVISDGTRWLTIV